MRRWAARGGAPIVRRSQHSFVLHRKILPSVDLASATQSPLLNFYAGRYRRCSTTTAQNPTPSNKDLLLAEYEKLKENDRVDQEKFSTIVKSLFELGDWEEAFQMYFELQATGKSPDPRVLLNPLSEESARPLYNEMPIGHISKLVKDTTTFPVSQLGRILNFLTRFGKKKEVMEVVNLMDEANIPRCQRTYFHLMLAHIGEGMGKVFSIYEEMLQKRVRPDIQVYISLLRCALRHSTDEKFEEHLNRIRKDMKKFRVPPTYQFYRILCHHFISEGRLTDAMEGLKDMRKDEVEPADGYLYFALVTNLARNGDIRLARDILQDIKGESWLNAIPYTSVINACARQHDFGNALAVFEGMKADGVKPDVIAYNAVIYACISTGNLERAMDMVNEMEKEGIKPRTDTFNALLTGYVKANRMDEANQLFEHMSTTTDTLPDSHTYNALLSGPIKLDDALALVEKMKQNNITPGTVTYNILIHICGSSGDLDKAFEYATLLENNSAADMITYTALFSSCLYAKNSQLAMQVVQKLRAAQKAKRGAMFSRSKKTDRGDKGILADEQCYGVMMEICLRLNYNDEALTLLTELLSQENLHPTPRHKEAYTLYKRGDKEGALALLRQLEMQHKALCS